MYEQYWNLACRPFENHFVPAFYFRGQSHEAARLKLRYAIENRLGAAVLSGGIGTGKTALAILLQHELKETCGPSVHLVFPQMPATEYLAYLAAKLGAIESGSDTRRGVDGMLACLEGRLRAFAEQGQRPTIVLDEAHLIEDVRVFECLQLLLNFQDDMACSFSLLFVGGPSFLGRLQRMPQFNERIAIRSVLEPLSREETAGYVAHRLNAAGAQHEIFDQTALSAISDRSGGIPRRINRLADLALLVGFAEHLTTIGAGEIAAVAEELPPAIAA
jgi:type II secretory pathway predicted ATPase ExeA